MKVIEGCFPPEAADVCRVSDGLFGWMGRQFDRYGDTYQSFLFGRRMYATRSAEFAYHVLVENWQNYVKGQMIERVAILMGDGLVTSEGDLWRRQRRMIQPSFNHESLAPLSQLITGVNSDLCRKWQIAARKNEGVNVTRDVSHAALEVVLRFLLGEDYDHLASHFDLLSEEKARDMAFARAFLDLRKVIQRLIERRRKEPSISVDALGAFMQARDPQTGQLMADRQLIDEILTMLVAGHETTATTLNWMWYLLSQHPDVEGKLDKELKLNSFSGFADLSKFPYTRQIVEEVMRLYPALWLISRRAIADDRLGGYAVPAGTEIYTPPYFIQHNPEIWKDPERFDPDRFSPANLRARYRFAAIPFGAGPRNCIGSHFARAEMQIHLLTIGARLRLRYVQPRPIEIEAGVNLRNKFDFIMHPEMKE
ncbi:MAG: cytochrome P450 [Terriglobia bacterium]